MHEWLTLTVRALYAAVCSAHSEKEWIFYVTWITWNWCQPKSYKLFKQFASEFNLFNLRISSGMRRKCVSPFLGMCAWPARCTGHAEANVRIFLVTVRRTPTNAHRGKPWYVFLVGTLRRRSPKFLSSYTVRCFRECLHSHRYTALLAPSGAREGPLKYIMSSQFILFHYRIWH